MTTAHDTPLLLALASHNKGKLEELRALLAELPVQLLSAAELDCAEPEENGDSFEANALIKALYVAYNSGLPALADDSGLVIPALDGRPGIHSARWAGESKDFNLAIARIQQELAALSEPAEPVAAYFYCSLCLAYPDGNHHLFSGRVDGTLIFPPQGERGFGYDPIFVPLGYVQTFAEMDAERKNAISHRARAFSAFRAHMESMLRSEGE